MKSGAGSSEETILVQTAVLVEWPAARRWWIVDQPDSGRRVISSRSHSASESCKKSNFFDRLRRPVADQLMASILFDRYFDKIESLSMFFNFGLTAGLAFR